MKMDFSNQSRRPHIQQNITFLFPHLKKNQQKDFTVSPFSKKKNFEIDRLLCKLYLILISLNYAEVVQN